MIVDRTEITEAICEMEAALTELTKAGLNGTRVYTMLWRRMMRFEEALNRHPY
jgi:hypothetical protein